MRLGELREQFQDAGQQAHAARLGIWLVVVSEILLFSALFALYAAFRVEDPVGFREGARHTSLWLGTAMTYLLLASSFVVALGVHASRRGAARACGGWLALAALLGVVFLALKGFEYREHLRAGLGPAGSFRAASLAGMGVPRFFSLYYAMTGLHALHVAVGVAVLSALALGPLRGRAFASPTPVELGGTYWHLVDAIWVFLWPLFYLLR